MATVDVESDLPFRDNHDLESIRVGMHDLLKTLAREVPHIHEKAIIESVVRPFIIEENDFKRVMAVMLEYFNKGLAKDTHHSCPVKMYPTYVRSVPDGTENGDFLALDVGGTNFRVLLISLQDQEIRMESKIYIIPQKLMVGHGTNLFDFIAECIQKFLKDLHLLDKKLPLGFTFSFCCKQVGLDKAILTQWAKGFKCEGVEGHNIVDLLHDAIKRRGDINVECVAVTNDTVGTLMSSAVKDRNCGIGLILGTGTNACYFENLENVELWDGDRNEPKQVIINTEWGALGDDGSLDFMMTEFDKKIDKHSIDPRVHVFEKMISGMYLGEIVRLVLEKLRKNSLLFKGNGSKEMSTRGRFYTKYVSEIESDVDNGCTNTRKVLDEMSIEKYNEDDIRILRYVCALVSTRAAHLAAAGVACLLNKMDRPEVTVAVDGSLYKFHPHFHDLMSDKVAQLVNNNIKFKLMLSSDGSGKGAALVAAVANRLRAEEQNTQ